MRATPSPAQVRLLRRRVLSWWRLQTFDYPWRVTSNPWLGLVAEVLLQRTRAAQVVPVYKRFAAKYPTPASFLKDSRSGTVTATLGLHVRADHLRAVADTIIRGVPTDEKELRKIRGIGAYTSAAWLSFHLGQRAVIVDANIFRWLGRMTGRPYHRDPRGVRWVRRCADQLTPRRAFRAYNYAVLDFTMSVCTPRKPKCETCVLQSLCSFGKRSCRRMTLKR